MKASTIRTVDFWLGAPACAVLTVWRRLFDRRKRPGPVKRILFFKLVEQGATVLAYPSLRDAIARVGAENVFFMVLEENRAILDLLETVRPENVISVPTGGLFTTLGGLIRGLMRVRREKIDSVLDFEFFARSSAIFSYLSGATRRVGYHRFQGGGPWRGDLMTHRLVYSPHVHSLRAMRVMVEALWREPEQLPALDVDQFSFDESLTRFRPSTAELEEVRGIMTQATEGAVPRRLVLLNANISDRDLVPLRRWDADRYVELARRLLAENDDVFIAFTGAPSEARDVEPMVRQLNHPRCFSMAGKTNMRQLLVLYSLAEVMVTNDSGPAHFATLTDIEIVTLFGPEVPRLWAPLGPRSHVIWLALPCCPCLSAYNNRLSVDCPENLCMKGITVDRVHDTVRGILAKT
ncbi:MAG: glycosyltransferase family 9 protein [Planctomycetia bacterium]|nr:glycosyltransferase family 9 protein [Planctomycetia bacterium]